MLLAGDVEREGARLMSYFQRGSGLGRVGAGNSLHSKLTDRSAHHTHTCSSLRSVAQRHVTHNRQDRTIKPMLSFKPRQQRCSLELPEILLTKGYVEESKGCIGNLRATLCVRKCWCSSEWFFMLGGWKLPQGLYNRASWNLTQHHVRRFPVKPFC